MSAIIKVNACLYCSLVSRTSRIAEFADLFWRSEASPGGDEVMRRGGAGTAGQLTCTDSTFVVLPSSTTLLRALNSPFQPLRSLTELLFVWTSHTDTPHSTPH
ncbi:unnamed protein product [Cercospora beticola]|nr:unnamed protein product [Cercospora beticola]